MTEPPQAARRTTARDWLLLAGFLALPLGVGQIGRFPAEANQDWYDGLAQLAVKPPGWAFPVAWTLLFVLMAVAAWLVWRAAVAAGEPERARKPLLLWGLQLAVNFTWPFVFFGAQAPLLGLLVILLLFLLVALTARSFADLSRPAAWLLVPYLLWLTYAAVLNAGIVVLN
ncbi:TspO/MBR family protein [Algihabitans albus]|uniref:TspO/MBR family protein n=1 Tax=Algihabitans albus TaxID=2164067 RepID=UPI000E5D8222|nr:TspO/MBR family protein [Algihabitans albus]